MGWQDGSLDKGTCPQALTAWVWPLVPCGRRRDSTSEGFLLVFTHLHCGDWPHTEKLNKCTLKSNEIYRYEIYMYVYTHVLTHLLRSWLALCLPVFLFFSVPSYPCLFPTEHISLGRTWRHINLSGKCNVDIRTINCDNRLVTKIPGSPVP